VRCTRRRAVHLASDLGGGITLKKERDIEISLFEGLALSSAKERPGDLPYQSENDNAGGLLPLSGAISLPASAANGAQNVLPHTSSRFASRRS
jgi:hypothetical protein